MSLNTFQYNRTFKLESGKRIRNLEIAYTTYGKINERRDNIVWVCHALTANSDVFDWWKGLFGNDSLFNPEEYFIICANCIGSAYGTTNPLSKDPTTGLPYFLSFPQFTIRDLVSAHELLANYLGIDKISLLIGGSLGGQQAIEWAISSPDRIKNLVLLTTNAQHSPWGIAFNESQRLAISTDRTFYANKVNGGLKGLKAARSIALLSYRAYDTYSLTQMESSCDKIDDFKASSYQNYQGEKLVKRFNAYSYWFLTKAMDSHNIARNRGSLENALKSIKAHTLVIGIKNDLLFPVEEQKLIANAIQNAEYFEIDSFYGHDGFLIETPIICKAIDSFLNKNNKIDKTRSVIQN